MAGEVEPSAYFIFQVVKFAHVFTLALFLDLQLYTNQPPPLVA